MKFVFFLIFLFTVVSDIKVLVIGDSITANGKYITYLDQETSGYEFKKAGYTGKGTGFILERLKDCKLSNYNVLVIEAGINNIDQPDKVIADFKEMFEYAKKENEHIKVIVLTIVPFKGYPTWSAKKQENLERVNQWLLTKPKNVDVVVDVYKNLSSSGFQIHSTDGLHPAPKGHKIISELIAEQL